MTTTQINYWNYVETNRHNLAEEREMRRANKARESENVRSNMAREAENFRSNTSNEAIKAEQNRINAQTNVINQARNAEQVRHNLVSEQHTTRSLDQDQQRIALGYANVDASRYAAGLSYATGMANVAEQQRSHMANEELNTIVAADTSLQKSRDRDVKQQELNLSLKKWDTGQQQLTEAQAYSAVQSGRKQATDVKYAPSEQSRKWTETVLGTAGRVASTLLFKRKVK